MRRLVISALVTATLVLAPNRPANAQMPPPQATLIIGVISGGLWAGIIYFYNKIGPDTCIFQLSPNSYYDLAWGRLETKTEDCGAAEIDVAGILRLEPGELLVVQPNPNTGWNFEARFQNSSCSNSFDHQLSVAVNAFLACLNSGYFTTSRPIYAISANGMPPEGASTYNWGAANLGDGKYGWTR